MANTFPKEVRVRFQDVCEGFEDKLVMSNAVDVGYNGSAEMQERTNDEEWKPMPYIMNSYDGRDQSSNFQDAHGLVVPVAVDTRKSVPWQMTDTDLRDKTQMDRIIKAGAQRLASDINRKVSDVVASTGTIIIAQSGAATGYDDVALCDTAMTTRGISEDNRKLALSSKDYNAMAGNLAARETFTPITSEAYKKARLGDVAGFETFKLDYGYNLTASTATGVTVNGAGQNYVPTSTTTVVGRETNTDNRYQDLDVTVTSGTIKVGDAFEIAGVNSVHNIAKSDTGEALTFRVVGIKTGAGGTGTITVSPPIISATGGTDIEKQYQNATAAPANGAAITMLNTASAIVNPFWKYESIELTPGIIMPEKAGIDALTYTTEQGIQIVMQKEGNVGTSTGSYRMDVYFGVTNKNPEMNGILMFGQS